MDIQYSVSSYINNGIIERKSNLLLEKIIGLFFRKVDFDKEGLSSIKESLKDGKIVYVSYQSTISSLLILNYVLKKNGLNVPFLALDFRPYLTQSISNMIKGVYRFFARIFSKDKPDFISDNDYIEYLLENDKKLALSLLSRKVFKKRYLDIQTDTLEYLIEIQKKSEQPIFILPKIMFWNRNPERTRGILTAKATGDRSLLAAIFTNLRSATPAFIRVSAPINLKEELEQDPGDDSKQIARKLRNKLLETYNYEKRSILGPVIKTQQEMIEKVLYHKNVMDTINEVVEEERTTEKKLRKKAYKYYKEIAADFSIIYIKFFDWSLKYVFNKIFDGISYDIEDLKKIREASQNGPLILMPSHKSHMDYLILSSIFYQNKLIPPHIVAGSNLTFFPMGKIFRRSGAFFMRRSFKGLPLYSIVFRQYIKTLINEGYSIEFFIEGGRTRTGKLAFPKMGILKYLIESIEEGYNKDMVFVPMSINYDRILEESAYLKEIKGKEKKSESTSAFVKSRKLLKRKYGRVYLTFNDPISYQELKKEYSSIEDPTSEIGYHILKKISDVIMVTPFAITTSAILLSSSKGFTRDLLKEKIVLLHSYLSYSDVNMSDSLKKSNFDEIIDYVLESYVNDSIISELNTDNDKEEGAIPDLYLLNEDERARINFYKNNVVHYLIPLSFVAIAMLVQKKDKKLKIQDMRSELEEVKSMFSKEFIYPEIITDSEKFLNSMLEFLVKTEIISKDDDNTFTINKLEDLKYFAKIIQDYLESYNVVFSTLADAKTRINKKDLISDIRKNGVKMYHLGKISLLESLSMPNYNNALDLGIKRNSIAEEKVNKKNSTISIVDGAIVKATLDKINAYIDLIS